MIKFLTIILFVSLFFINSARVKASELPEIPVLFYGTIKINNELVAKNTAIFVNEKVSNKQLVSGYSLFDGSYFLEVPCQKYINKNILFKIDDFVIEHQCVDAIINPSVKFDIILNSGGSIINFSNTCASVAYGNWQENCINNWQYRDIISTVPSYCVLSESQKNNIKKQCNLVLPIAKIDEKKIETGIAKVLSAKIYADGTLLRGIGSKKIYVIKNGKKQHIRTLTELRKKYFGKKIYNVNKNILDQY